MGLSVAPVTSCIPASDYLAWKRELVTGQGFLGCEDSCLHMCLAGLAFLWGQLKSQLLAKPVTQSPHPVRDYHVQVSGMERDRVTAQKYDTIS